MRCGHAPQYDLYCVCLFFTFLHMPSVSGQLSVLQKDTRQSDSHKDHHEVQRLVTVSCSPESVQCASATSTMAGMAHRSTTCTEWSQEHHQCRYGPLLHLHPNCTAHKQSMHHSPRSPCCVVGSTQAQGGTLLILVGLRPLNMKCDSMHGFLSGYDIVHSCYYATAILHRECYVWCIYNRMRFYRRKCYYTAAAIGYRVYTAAITPKLLYRECYVCGIYNRMRFYRIESTQLLLLWYRSYIVYTTAIIYATMQLVYTKNVMIAIYITACGFNA